MKNQQTQNDMNEPLVGKTFEEMVFKKALALQQAGESHGLIKEESLGKLEVFLNEKPKSLLMSLIYPNDTTVLAGTTIFIGSNS